MHKGRLFQITGIGAILFWFGILLTSPNGGFIEGSSDEALGENVGRAIFLPVVGGALIYWGYKENKK